MLDTDLQFIFCVDGFKGDIYLWMKCLLPGVVKQVYNLNSKQLVKLFSQVWNYIYRLVYNQHSCNII